MGQIGETLNSSPASVTNAIRLHQHCVGGKERLTQQLCRLQNLFFFILSLFSFKKLGAAQQWEKKKLTELQFLIPAT